MMALGFSAVYREGFEIVLFLQNVRLQVGTPTVVMGVLIRLGVYWGDWVSDVFDQPQTALQTIVDCDRVVIGDGLGGDGGRAGPRNATSWVDWHDAG
jgi:hypothetical protein